MAIHRKKLTAGRKNAVYVRDRATCQNCAFVPPTAHDAEQMEIDHVVPVAHGGSSQAGNLQVLCRRCNNCKGARSMDEFESEFWGRLGSINHAEHQRYGRAVTPAAARGWI